MNMITRFFRSGPVTLVKKIGDDVLVSVDIEGMQPANYIGFQLNYPASIIGPVLVAGSEHSVLYSASDVFGALECDVVANYHKDDQTLSEYVYFSKTVKALAVSTKENSRIATFTFKALAAGTGELTVTARKYGKLLPSGEDTEYNSVSDPLQFSLAEPETPVQVVARFKIVVE